MNIYLLIIPFVGTVIALLLGFFVLAKKVSLPINQVFALFCFETSFWQFCWFFSYFLNSHTEKDLIVRIAFSVIVFIPFTYYHFALIFLDLSPRQNYVFIAYLYGVIFFVLTWNSNLFIAGYRDFWWGYYPKVGTIFPLYLFGVFSFMARGIFLIFKKLRNKAIGGNEHTKMKYIAITLFLYFFATIEYAIDYGIPLYPIGAFFMIGVWSIMAYAITKHEVMDISVIINRASAWIMTIFFFGSIYISLFGLHQALIGANAPWAITLWTIPYGILVGETFQRVRLFIQTTGERKFIKGHYNSDILIKNLTEKLIPAVTISDATKLLRDTLKEALEIDNACIYISESKKDGVPQAYSPIETDNHPKIESSHPFIHQISPIPIFLKTLPTKTKEAIKDFECLTKGEILIPLFSSDHLEAFIIIGKKASENSYDQRDITLLETIMNHMLVIFDRIRPYEEVKEKFETTERKLMESEKMLNRSARLASLGTLTAGVTHEIRNPLAVIRLGINKLPAEPRDIEYLKAFKEKYMKHVERIANIVDKMLHLSKEKERTEMGVDLNKLIEDYLIEFIPTSGKVTIVKDLKPIPQIIGIADDLHQVLTNFADNAIHAMPDGGTLTIKTYSTTEDHAQKVVVEISDTGMGIPKAIQEKIFDPFFSTRHEGTGLGLSISHKIIEAHRGKIELNSEEGKGTTFKIIFPSA
ncbi:hypothetical protein A3J90_02675 [candidate division WOR-1 bacterium RIFOXYC2_FULL_37_10]|uniref:histidine kinase n=1 Tax=candidate division WOR-1 bacterium RIFOXYB2_FULL_37_13 TaxID=1802579 RepID=A0A1F4SHU8_UNCSA|nr:MAG: hypothetical protein A2310_01245 [candidate division WOR-1 bacterium RIFOXYB2_FULL_37_13]OGC36616.1 MAG: hypothetical protein A3J90_02675 [candidate division WOR-1 bacterium RIFOXYC2_FULL_37_10]